MGVYDDKSSRTQAFSFAQREVVEIDGFVPVECCACVETGELEEVVDEALHRDHFVERVPAGAGPGCIRWLVKFDLEPGSERREWTLEFVSGVGHESALA